MIDQRDPRSLTPHHYIRDFPRWPADSDGFRGFCNDIREFGIKNPLKILPDGTVLDGETRRLAAVEIGLETVPCEVVPAEEEYGTMVRELVQRRNLTQSAKAYWGYHLFMEAHSEFARRSRQHRNGFLKKGAQLPSSDPSLPVNLLSRLTGDPSEFSDFLGIGRDTFYKAAKVHEIFAQDPSYKAQILPEINERGLGLGAVVAGWAGQKATKGKERPDMPEDLRFKTTLRQLGIRVAKLPDVDVMRRAVQSVVREAKEDDLDRWFMLADELRVQLRTRMHRQKEER